jgi:hypothetical protein
MQLRICPLASYVYRFQLWDAYGILPTICGIKDRDGVCTNAGIEAKSMANCIMPLDAIVNDLKNLKVIKKQRMVMTYVRLRVDL